MNFALEILLNAVVNATQIKFSTQTKLLRNYFPVCSRTFSPKIAIAVQRQSYKMTHWNAQRAESQGGTCFGRGGDTPPGDELDHPTI